ncbi:MAG: hypothetical protein F4103_18810 [Boseongicola sp. SB0673_bin_14]|nr:hypothetical protein [Boseongicola sp. SB0667_bin_21]MYI70692.1 hypothetical protein [Boseongicola sp. SB0673_bin_14]
MTHAKTRTVSTVVALALTLSPAPATADSEHFGKILAGLAVFGLLAAALDDIDELESATKTQTRRAGHGHHGPRHRDHASKKSKVINGQILWRNGTGDHGYRSAPLPDKCRRTVISGGGHRTVYSAACLDRRYRHASRLPSRCERIVRTVRKDLIVYGARCLARDNWRVRMR